MRFLNTTARAVLIGAVLAVAAPVAAMPAPQTAASPSEDSAKAEAARALVMATNPLPIMQKAAADGFALEFGPAVASNPFFADMEAKTPGFVAFMDERLRETVTSQIEQVYPSFIDALVPVVMANMTIDDMVAATAFYQSPVGQKLLAMQADMAALDPAIMACIRTGQSDCITARNVTDNANSRGYAMLAQLDDNEIGQVAEFYSSPAGAAVIRMTPGIAQATADWTNTSIAQMQAAAIGAVQTAIADWQDMQEEKTKP